MKNDNHIILKSGRILNACIGVLTSEIVSLLFSVSTFLVLGSLFLALQIVCGGFSEYISGTRTYTEFEKCSTSEWQCPKRSGCNQRV